MRKILYSFIISAFLLSGINTASAAVSAPVKPQTPIQLQNQQACQALTVSPLSVIDNPDAFLGKTVSFTGEFVSFTSLGLDYKPAFKDSSKYIGILLSRPDVKHHTIPMSEFKMFVTRETAEKNIDIETGDKVKLTGRVFSAALGDPWLDITEFKITDKKNKEAKK